jgi:hypothetical protein
MSTHSHSAGNLHPGGYDDQTDRPDAGLGAGGIGHAKGHYESPITGMTTPTFVASCPSCQAAIKWHHHGGNGVCGGCGIPLTTHPDNGHPMVA